MTILITGGTGFAGSHLLEALLDKAQTDRSLPISLHTTSFSPPKLDRSPTGIQVHQLDLTNQTDTFDLIARLQPDQLYHLASFASAGQSFDQAEKIIENNLKLQLNILEAVKQFSPKTKILTVGSGMEYDLIGYPSDQPITEDHPLGPNNPYSLSKIIQDLASLSYIYSHQLQIVRARPFNHTGERQSPDFAIPSFAQQIVAIERGQQTHLTVGNLSAVRDITDVKDVVKAYMLLMEVGQTQEVYNIGSGQGWKMSAIVQQLCQLSSAQIEVVVDQTRLRPSDVAVTIADIQKISDLGWQPAVPLTQTLERVLNYWRTA